MSGFHLPWFKILIIGWLIIILLSSLSSPKPHLAPTPKGETTLAAKCPLLCPHSNVA